MTAVEPFPLPRGWTKTVRSSVIHAVALASVALTRAWGSAARKERPVQVVAERDRAKSRAEIRASQERAEWSLAADNNPRRAGKEAIAGYRIRRRQTTSAGCRASPSRLIGNSTFEMDNRWPECAHVALASRLRVPRS